MKRLFTIDLNNYTEDMPVFEKHTVRAIIIRDGKVAMQKSRCGEYKIPGGGVEAEESHIVALRREAVEETGLIIEEDSVEEIGEVLELREDLFEKGRKYVCHSYFYLCKALDEVVDTKMTESEIEKGFEPVWATPEEISASNRRLCEKCDIPNEVIDRDTSFIEYYFKLSNSKFE